MPPSASERIGSLDKAIHLCEYLLFAWCIVRASRASRLSHVKTLTVAFLWSVGWGCLLEGLQAWLPYRSAEWGDVAANVLGTLAGVWIGMMRPKPAIKP